MEMKIELLCIIEVDTAVSGSKGVCIVVLQFEAVFLGRARSKRPRTELVIREFCNICNFSWKLHLSCSFFFMQNPCKARMELGYRKQIDDLVHAT